MQTGAGKPYPQTEGTVLPAACLQYNQGRCKVRSINFKIYDIDSAENSEDIKKVLGGSEGIKHIIIDDETGIAEILYAPELISVDDMKRTIYEIGYRAD